MKRCAAFSISRVSLDAVPQMYKAGFSRFGGQGSTVNVMRSIGGAAMSSSMRWKSTTASSAAGAPEKSLQVTVIPSEVGANTANLFDLLTKDGRSKNLGIPDYIKTEYSFTAILDGEDVGGCVGEIAWNQFHVSMIAIDTSKRGAGVGGALLKRVEEVALAKGCDRIQLETFSWQARPFYEKLGFVVFGTQDDYPTGFQKFFLEKRISATDDVKGTQGSAADGKV